MYMNSVSLPDFTHRPIDIHSHFDHGSPYDSVRNITHVCDITHLEAVYQHAGVLQVGISTFASVLEHAECVMGENAYLHKLIDEK